MGLAPLIPFHRALVITQTHTYTHATSVRCSIFKIRNKTGFSLQSPPPPPTNRRMEAEEAVEVYLCGKSSAEKEVALQLHQSSSSSSSSSNQLHLSNSSLQQQRHQHQHQHQLVVRLQSDLPKWKGKWSFEVESYMRSLTTSRFGRFLIWSPRLPSTHDLVSLNFCNLPVGAVCVADLQFKGRGRSSNVWESPPGCLMFSFTLQMDDGRLVPLIQYVASLALTDAITHLCLDYGFPQLGVKIKWPNDLFLNGFKVGGVLCTSTYKSKTFNISVGIGLNIDNKHPTTCLNSRLQQISSTTCRLRKEDILASFFHKFENFLQLFLSKGFQPLEELYYQTWLHSGQRVIVQDICEGQPVDNVVTIQGLTSSGYLLAVGDDGQMCELHPDGNSLDFFKGLVKHKTS